MTAEDVARQHYLDRRRLSDAVAELARRAWSRLNPANLDSSWQAAAPELLVGLAGAQLAAARAADDYTAEVLEEDGPDAVNPAAFAGRASDGRPLDTLLLNPITVVKMAIAGQVDQAIAGETMLTGRPGLDMDQALAAGYANLDMLVRTQLADAGRAADQVALVAHPAAEGYTRMLVGRSCSRCLVLAGRWYAWNSGFRRHPRCDCIHVPGRRPSDGVQVDLRRTFESMSRADQDKTFTINGAQAIRDGADINRVVNARRGMATAGETRTRVRADGLVVNESVRRQTTTRVGGRDVFTTTEATTRRGINRKVRLMPEEIYRIAGHDRAEALRLLRTNGYLTGAAARAPRPATVRTPVVVPPRLTAEQRFRAAATGGDALASATFGLDRRPRPPAFTPEMARAVNTYTGSEYAAINNRLRGLPLPYGYTAEEIAPAIAGLDRAMAASRLDRDVATYRGVQDASRMFGDRLAGSLAGLEWREDAYLSTSAQQPRAAGFAGRSGTAPMVMRILTPAGTPAIEASGMDLEAELLLRRGLRLRVVADRGVSPDGVRHIDVEVLGD